MRRNRNSNSRLTFWTKVLLVCALVGYLILIILSTFTLAFCTLVQKSCANVAETMIRLFKYFPF